MERKSDQRGLVAVDGNKLSALPVEGRVKVRVVEIVVLEKGGSLAVITVVDEESPSLDEVSDKVVAVALLLVVPLIVVLEEELAVVLVVEAGLVGVGSLVVEGVLVEARLEADVFVGLLSALVSLEIVEDDGVEKFEDNVEEGEFENNNEVEDRVEVDVNEEESKGNAVVEEKVEGNADEVVSENEDVEEEVTDDVEEGESGDDDEVEEKVEEVDVGEVEGPIDVEVVSDVV
ncbi:hypothetical protein BDP67DRAFT_570395 [Colletotrichum lupini]|nr:hypothetical protein BDP67DRAFT_570395 [Colletotrichum lupini]